ncbi:2673_t:CDS:2 [Dentiscutata erythropus]|uniref:2673_t:CDS:1 n=1 Tax=Dentiscutata erythropus TaxID=1348616 RepID=A0A9N8ZHW5_9GLOM|nr:2673_t:CDS:2 [Dentiscutata erythropus]
MPTTTLPTARSQQSGTKPTNNNSVNPSIKRAIWLPFVSAISKKSVDAASKANHKFDTSNTNNHHLNDNEKTKRQFHDSKLDLSKPGKNLSSNKVCSRSNSSSSISSCNSCATNNTDNTSPSSTSNSSLRSLNTMEMMFDDDNNNNNPEITNKNGHIISKTNNDNELLDTTTDVPQSSQHHAIKSSEFANKSILSTSTKVTKVRPSISSISWVEEITEKSFATISTDTPQLDSLINNVVDSNSSRLNDNSQCETLPSTQPCTRKTSTIKSLQRRISKKKDSEKIQDNVTNSTKLMIRTLSLLKYEIDEKKIKDSPKNSSGRCSRSKSFNELLYKENNQVGEDSIKDFSKKFNFRKKRGSVDSRPISSPDSSLKRILDSSTSDFDNVAFVTGTSDITICDSPTTESPTITTSQHKRCSSNNDLNDNSDIRRSWTHIEVHLRGLLFSRKRALDAKRRNSYAYTNSLKTNQQLVAESEIRIHLHKNRNSNVSVDEDTVVVKDPPTLTLPADIFALQADAEKETDAATRSSQMRKFIACEIYSTEQSYLEHLKKLKKIFMDPFIDAAEQSNPLVNPDDIKAIFDHVEDLIQLSTLIVEDLESSMDPWQESESMVGEVFLKYRSYFEALLLYAENHQQSRSAIKRANENVLYRKILQLKRYTPEFHMDYDDLCHSVDNMKTLALQCDKAIQRP